ncbi:MAG: ABC-type transport auxiliary lipoprotein family protein [Ramlibacter sp.]
MKGHAGQLAGVVLAAVLAGCSALPDKPVRATLYDFGPAVGAPPATPPTMPAIVLSEIEALGALDGSAILYRLGYADDHQLRPYAQARWSAPPPQLVRQRLRLQLGRDRAVLDLGDSVALARTGGAVPRIMRIDLEEFSHLFESQTQSWGLLRLRVTLMENTPGGEKLLAQRNFVVRKPAPTPDAPGGVRALAAATDAAAVDIAQWLRGMP